MHRWKSFLFVGVSLLILTACGGKLADTGENLGEAPQQVKEEVKQPEKIKPLDVQDLSNYFVIVDGTKVVLPDGCTLQELLDKGFEVKEDINLEEAIPYGVYSSSTMKTYVDLYKAGAEKAYFRAYVHNPEHSKLPLKDCKVYGIGVSNPEADISILGNLKMLDGQEKFKEVLGLDQGEKVPGYKDTYFVSFPTKDGYGQISYTYRKEDGKVKDMLVSYISPDM